MSSEKEPHAEGMVLNMFCTPEDDAWRVYIRPTWMPTHLRRCFDEEGEAFPAYLDFDDLDRYMAKRGVQIEKHVSRRGDVELTAHGKAASELATWFTAMFSSGMRADANEPSAKGRSG